MMTQPKIYSDAYQLSITIFERTGKFPRWVRPTLGRRLEESSLDLTLFLRRALTTDARNLRARREHLQLASSCIDQIRIEAQVARDLKFLAAAPYQDMCELTAELGRQIGGLLKHNPNLKQNASTSESPMEGTSSDDPP
jgi:hypothetical protein